MRRFISIETANNMLPLLKSIVTSLQETWLEIIYQKDLLTHIQKGEKELEESIKAKLSVLIDKINGYIKEVEDLGCFVEEFRRGIVNFPTLYLGRKVFFTWKLGEDAVQFWHELDESYNDRMPIRDVGNFLSRAVTSSESKN
jgi:hypothetical protein